MNVPPFLRHGIPFVRFLWQQLQIRHWQQSAAALTYTSLFALVPLITVSYALLTFMPQLVNVQGHVAAFIFSHFLPDTGYQVWDYLTEFSHQARNLTVPGLLILIITALMMLKTIENAFNAIWEVKQGRKGIASFLLYWAVLSLGPLLIGAAFMLSTYLASLTILSDVQQLSLIQQLLSYMPLLLSTVALCLMYSAIPNCTVPFKNALAGAFVTAIVFGIVKDGFALSVKYSSYTLIYGAFAAVPLFLSWVYLCWMIVLFGAVLVRSFSTYSDTHGEQQNDVSLALIILETFWQQQQSGKSLKTSALLRGKGRKSRGISLLQWERQQKILSDHHIIESTANDHYVLCRNLQRISLWDIQQMFSATAMPLESATSVADAPTWLLQAQMLLQENARANRQQLSISLADLFQAS